MNAVFKIYQFGQYYVRVEWFTGFVNILIDPTEWKSLPEFSMQLLNSFN